ncbi:helix-turn-helix transcriptional regulator [Collinsella tanakaei]|nr:helix-turn-helix transcriptional regulator [Collinsella tanakaei]
MACLGGFFDYAINDYGAEAAEIADIFMASPQARQFERGAPWVVSGCSGVELFWDVSCSLGYAEPDEMAEPSFRVDRTPEYWAGWVLAYVQWRLVQPFRLLFAVLPFEELVSLYHPWHEASEQRVAALVVERWRKRFPRTNLARLRGACGLTQQKLAELSGVGLRSIQMYEQRNKDINHARGQVLQRLARTLHCRMESLLEPEFDL